MGAFYSSYTTTLSTTSSLGNSFSYSLWYSLHIPLIFSSISTSPSRHTSHGCRLRPSLASYIAHGLLFFSILRSSYCSGVSTGLCMIYICQHPFRQTLLFTLPGHRRFSFRDSPTLDDTTPLPSASNLHTCHPLHLDKFLSPLHLPAMFYPAVDTVFCSICSGPCPCGS